MKYWRGYLVAGIVAVVTWAMTRFAARYTELVDMVYPYLTRTMQTFLANWTGGVDFCLWQVLAVLLVVLLLASVVLMILFRWNPVQWLGWVLAVVSVVWMLHTGVYGLNYYAGPLADDVRIEVAEYTLSDLEDATTYFRDQANALAVKMDRSGSGSLEFPEFEELAGMAGEGFHALTYGQYESVFAGSTLPVKKLAWADLYTSMGILGVTMPLTGEAGVNPQMPAVGMPFTMCHEMAHRMSIALERDANLAGFLACQANPNPEFQYSAYFNAYRYCISALSAVSTPEAAAAAARISAGVNESFRRDMAEYDAFFARRQSAAATKIATAANDSYIKVSGDSNGVASYGDVCDLLVNWHIQRIVLPQQVVEENNSFDPFHPETAEQNADES